MDRHTPGPWRAQLWGNGRGRSYTVGPDPRGGVAVARKVPNAADAALIAAAPDLLEALQAMVERFGDFAPGRPFEFPADHPVVAARAAIAKATGGVP